MNDVIKQRGCAHLTKPILRQHLILTIDAKPSFHPQHERKQQYIIITIYMSIHISIVCLMFSEHALQLTLREQLVIAHGCWLLA